LAVSPIDPCRAIGINWSLFTAAISLYKNIIVPLPPWGERPTFGEVPKRTRPLLGYRPWNYFINLGSYIKNPRVLYHTKAIKVLYLL
jgi:hypothetical protein